VPQGDNIRRIRGGGRLNLWLHRFHSPVHTAMSSA
jgi:hypothetical protein